MVVVQHKMGESTNTDFNKKKKNKFVLKKNINLKKEREELFFFSIFDFGR